MAKTGMVAADMMPRTRSSPGADAKPIVRSSSPTSARVSGSGSSRAPISNTTSAHAAHAISAMMLMNTIPCSVVPPSPRDPMPAARLESTTMASA